MGSSLKSSGESTITLLSVLCAVLSCAAISLGLGHARQPGTYPVHKARFVTSLTRSVERDILLQYRELWQPFTEGPHLGGAATALSYCSASSALPFAHPRVQLSPLLGFQGEVAGAAAACRP